VGSPGRNDDRGSDADRSRLEAAAEVVTLREHLELVVRPNMSEMLENLDDLRLAFNAIAAVDALAAHIYWWVVLHQPAAMAGLANDTEYRAKILVPRSHDFQLVFETAKAMKHVRLNRGTPKVGAVDQVVVIEPAWDDFQWDDFNWDTAQVRIEPIEGEPPWTVEGVLTRALAFLETEMATLEIP
jgi:hypothetical protein